MKKWQMIVVVPTAAMLALVGCGSTAPAEDAGSPAGSSGSTLDTPLPALIKSQGSLRVGVKCDYPPFGYIDTAGKNAGYGIEIVKQLAQYAFNDEKKVDYTCVTGSNRVPYLESNKIDLIVASMSWTPERAKVITFSTPYFTSGVKLLVPQDSGVHDFPDLDGKNVIAIKGTTASLWLAECVPGAKQLTYNQTSEAVAALGQSRGVAFAQDDTLLVDIASKNKKFKVVGSPKAASPWGMGTRKGDSEWSAWVDAALAQMQKDDIFWGFFTKSVTDPSGQETFKDFVPRPDNTLEYPTGAVNQC